MRFTVKAPASSANIGPGFDAIGIALDLWNEADIAPAAEMRVVLEGPDGPMLIDHENLVVIAMDELAREHGRELPPISLTLRANVPVARGLGSSAAAIVIGLFAANEVLELSLTPEDLYQVALRMEGHGDNVGAAIFGGAILAAPGMSGVIRLWHERSTPLDAVVFIPDETSMTHLARAALPRDVPIQDAAFNLAAASSLSVGLVTGNLDAIAAGMQDRLHEPYRAELFPHLEPMKLAAREAGAIGGCLSGAGPTVLALVTPHAVDRVADALMATAVQLDLPGRVCPLRVVERGAHVIY